MNAFKKYLIEFFVIVLGVSVSFLAEQWRQNINERNDIEVIVQNVKAELKKFNEFDSVYQTINPEKVLKQIIFEDSINNDSFLQILSLITYNGELKNLFPNLYLLSQYKTLNTSEFALAKDLTSEVDYLIFLFNDNSQKTDNLYHLFDKYGVLDDLLKIQEADASKGEFVNWNPSQYGIIKQGNYKALIQDKECKTALKLIYSNLLDIRLVIQGMKNTADSYYKTNH